MINHTNKLKKHEKVKQIRIKLPGEKNYVITYLIKFHAENLLSYVLKRSWKPSRGVT